METRFLVVDLEATCSDDGSIPPEEMEIIEIGACLVTESGVVLERFQHLVSAAGAANTHAILQAIDQHHARGSGSRTTVSCRRAGAAGLHQRRGVAGYRLDELGKLRSKATGRRCAAPWDCYAFAHAPPECQAPVCEGSAHWQRSWHGSGVRANRHQPGGADHRGLDDAINIAKLMPWVLGHVTLADQRQASAAVSYRTR